MWDQVRNNALSLISLLVALSALGYNTWRNELTEQNRNIRHAGFEMLLHIGELQRITYLAHYDMDQVQGNPRQGWTEVLVLKDLGELLPPAGRLRVMPLFQAWETGWQGLGSDAGSISRIDSALGDLRTDVLTVLKSLD